MTSPEIMDAFTAGIETSEAIRALSDPDMYPGNLDRVECRQTHASAVFLAGDDVYKLKKPVDFGFLNYSSLARRRLMCHLEVQLNRRLAPDVYRGVVELVWRDGRLRIGGPGIVVDCLVHLRRLPDEATLSARIRDDAVDEGDIDAVALRIARFHRDAERSFEIDRWGLPATVSHNVEENFQQVQPYIGQTIPAGAFERIAGYARDFLVERRTEFLMRVRDGMVRDGHGDIRAGHVYLLNAVEIIDCIEFNDRLRYGDVAADVGFLAMDLDARNRPDLSDRLIAVYPDATGFDVDPVLDFYRSYRAFVRGKVASFRLDEPDLSEPERGRIEGAARRYFHLAHRFAACDRGPRLIVMSGVTGTGKSTLARALADLLPADVIDSDTTRKRLAGLDPSSRQEPAFESGIYSRETSEAVYQTLLDRAAPLLERGRTVLLDATYLRRSYRRGASELARRYGARLLFVHCDAPEQEVRSRLQARGQDPGRISDGRWEIYTAQRAAFERFDDLDAPHLVSVDSTRSLGSQTESVLARLELPATSTA